MQKRLKHAIKTKAVNDLKEVSSSCQAKTESQDLIKKEFDYHNDIKKSEEYRILFHKTWHDRILGGNSIKHCQDIFGSVTASR